MIPYGFYLRAMFYNKKLFEEAGLDGPPETLDDFMASSKAISELDGKTGYCHAWWHRRRQWLRHDDGQHDGP